MLIAWLLAVPLFYILVIGWVLLAPQDAMSAIGNARRQFRTWVWQRAKNRYIRRHKYFHSSTKDLLQTAERYAELYTFELIGEPDEAERYW